MTDRSETLKRGSTLLSGEPLAVRSGSDDVSIVDGPGPSPLSLPSLGPADIGWAELHSATGWPELLEALGPLLVALFGPSDWNLALPSDDRILWMRGDGREEDLGTSTRRARAVFDRQAGLQEAVEDRTAYAIPLLDRGVAVGVLEITLPADAFDERRAAQLSRHLAVAVRNIGTRDDLRARAVRDETTGLFNAQHLNDVLARELERGRRFGHPVSVLFIDIDHFKAVNDKFGHLVGTALLVEMADRLRKTIRHVDLPHRYGGDEFVLVLVQTSREAARHAAERIQKALCEPITSPDGASIRVTVSVGVAAYPQDGDRATDILGAADRALYRAKASGRNEVVSTEDL